MNRFAYARAGTFAMASELLKDARYKLPILKGGGIDVLDHLKERLLEPDLVIDVRSATADGVAASIRLEEGKLHLPATCTLTQIAASADVVRQAPALAQAAGSAASPQVRNVATAAGNLLQRPRCWYYRHAQFDCLKKAGPTCYAIEGENRYHAIFGDGPCHIVHPSNLAPALWVCGGVVHLAGSGRSTVSIKDLFHMPDKGVRDEHNLQPGEVITGISCDAAPSSGFYAIKEKQSFDWPVAAASVALVLEGTTIKSARVCAGAVAPTPWPLPAVEAALAGVSIADDDKLRKACGIASEGAVPMRDNAYKVKLLPVAVRRATLLAAGKTIEEVES